MRCHSCGGKRKGDPENFGFRCPSCGHQVAASKKRDRLTDGAVQAALDAVTKSGQFRVLPEHIGYELHRRGRVKADRRRKEGPLGVGLLALGGLVGWLWSEGVALCFIIVGILLIIRWFRRGALEPTDGFATARRFLGIHPQDTVLDEQAPLEAASAEHELAVSAARLLVCQHERYARYLYCNDFHLVQACPIVGPSLRSGQPGGPAADAGEDFGEASGDVRLQVENPGRQIVADCFPGVLQRFRDAGAGTVFVLHDHSPAGEAFVNRVRQAPEWFGSNDAIEIVDLGIGATQAQMSGATTRPLSSIPGAATTSSRGGTGTELTALRPSRLMAAAAVAVGAGVPLVMMQGPAGAAAANRSDSGG